jgi:dUTP pyrophosphatase
MILKFKKTIKDVKTPTRGTKNSSGLDIFSPDDYVVPPFGDVLINSGLIFDIPENYDLSFYNKSGVSTKLKLIKGAELIDSDYRGNIHIHLFNISNKEVKINKGDKISQIVLRPVIICDIQEVNEIDLITERGDGGFGSTGEI